jgi:hypothetical protein
VVTDRALMGGSTVHADTKNVPLFLRYEFDEEEEARVLRPNSQYKPGRKLTAKEIRERNTTFQHVSKINLKRFKELRPPPGPYKPKFEVSHTPQNSYTLLLQQHRLQLREMAERSPERRFKERPASRLLKCEDGGFEAIQVGVAKSRVWRQAQADQRQEWLEEAVKVE